MQIRKFEMQNWRNFHYLEFVPKRINALIGPNGSGKTSILEALKTVMNGKAPTAFARNGAPFVSVSAEIEDVGDIQRSWNLEDGKTSTKMNGKNATSKSIQKMLEDVYGVSSQTTDIMSSSEVMEAAFGNKFAEYVLSFIKNDMDVDHLIALCSPSPDAEAILRDYFPPVPELIELDDIDEAFSVFKKKRSEIKGALDTDKRIAALFAGDPPEYTRDELDRKIEQLSTELGKLLERDKAYKNAVAAKKSQEAQIVDLEDKLSKMKRSAPSKKTLDELHAQLTDVQNRIVQLTKEVSAFQSAKDRLLQIIENLNTSVCPISAKLICTTDKTGLKSDLQSSVNEYTEMIVSLQASIAEENEKKTALEDRSRECLLAAQEAKYRKTYQEMLKTAQETVIVVPDPVAPEDISKVEGDIAELNRIKKIVNAYEVSVQASERVIKEQADLKVYDEIISLFDTKSGIRQKILEHNIAPLQNYCDEVSVKFWEDYRVLLDCSSGLNIRLIDREDNKIPYEAISTGEKLRVMFVLTDMLNALNGFRILILDNLDGLDKQGLEDLMAMVVDHVYDYDHIFLASVDSTEAKEAFSNLPKRHTNVMTLS